jgi:hypothetical protein
MDLKTVLSTLDQIVVDHNKQDVGNFRVGVVVHRPGALGGTPCVDIQDIEVKRIDKGFDWDSRKILITLDKPISLLTNEERDAITKDFSKSTSREGYDQFKQFRARIAELEQALITVGHGLRKNLDEQRGQGESAMLQEDLIEVIKALGIKGY